MTSARFLRCGWPRRRRLLHVMRSAELRRRRRRIRRRRIAYLRPRLFGPALRGGHRVRGRDRRCRRTQRDRTRDGFPCRGSHFDCRRIPVGGLLGQSGGDHLIKGRRDRRAFGGPRRRGHHVPDGDLLERVSRERLLSGQALIEHTGQGVDVRTGVNLTGIEPFWCHVGPRADRRAGRGQPGVVGGACDTEVDEIGVVVLVHQDVGRFDVPVDQPHVVGVVQRRRDLVDDRHGPLWLERAPVDQRFAGRCR